MDPSYSPSGGASVEVRKMRGQISPVLKHAVHTSPNGAKHSPNHYKRRLSLQKSEEVRETAKDVRLTGASTKRGANNAREDSRELTNRAKKTREQRLSGEAGEGVGRELAGDDEEERQREGRLCSNSVKSIRGPSSRDTACRQTTHAQTSLSKEQGALPMDAARAGRTRNQAIASPLPSSGSDIAQCVPLGKPQSCFLQRNAELCSLPSPIAHKVDNPLPLSPRSPLQAQESCKCKEHSQPASESKSPLPFIANRAASLTPSKPLTACEVVEIQDDSVDSIAESALEEAEQDCQSPLRTMVVQEPMQPTPEKPASAKTVGSRKFVVLSSDNESGNDKAADSEQRRDSSSSKKRRLSLDDLVHRRSARLLQLSAQNNKPKASNSHQEEDSKASQSPRVITIRNEGKSSATEATQLVTTARKTHLEDAAKRLSASSEIEELAEEGEEEEEEEEETVAKKIEADPPSGSSGCTEDPAELNAAVKKVKKTLRLFNSYYLRYVQEEEGRCRKEEKEVPKHAMKSKKQARRHNGEFEDDKRKSRRPDLKAIKQMKEEGSVLHKTKRVGHIPGVFVGDQFFSRCEMTAIGLHDHWLAGIDYAGSSYRKELSNVKLPVAISLVLSGEYEDDIDNSEDVIYTGQGGNDLLGKKRQIANQTMDRGNLALKNSMEHSLPVRLIRGHKTKKSYTGKVYTYDGLYKVKEFWAEKGISGFTVYKFRLHRLEGQAVLTTDQVHYCRGQVPSSTAELRGLVCMDISGGLEGVPVPASNVVDDPPIAPNDFKYISAIEVNKGVPKPIRARGCTCKGDCVDETRCACAMLNGKRFPYVTKNGGRLVEPMDVVYECGPKCGCGPSCSNRVSQRGLYYRLEVFRTANKGWGVRSWDLIPAGAPVCEYTGLLMRAEDADSINANDYIFDLDCVQTIKGIGGRQRRVLSKVKDVEETVKAEEDADIEQPEYCINAGNSGNVSRFINHSCEPNLFVQCVLNAHHDLTQPRVFLFASENIHPLQELTYDYGYELDSVVLDGKVKKVPCYCGAHGCRKRLY